MDKFRVFVYIIMDVSLKQRIPCIIPISIFGAFLAEKKSALYTGKYGTNAQLMYTEYMNYLPAASGYSLDLWHSFFPIQTNLDG